MDNNYQRSQVVYSTQYYKYQVQQNSQDQVQDYKSQESSIQHLESDNQDQKQNINQVQELNLLEIIEKCQKSFDEFIKNKKQNIPIVLLVGLTGSGKSTIFNFLSGADFTINQKKELEIINNNYPENNFSIMIGGMKSITKEPNFYSNKNNNHIIIDFPGFQDTNGEWDQLLYELIFHKIVTSGPIKVIYVIKNPENNLPNRGQDLQEFINKLYGQDNKNKKKFNLILNCYLEELSNENLISKIKQELKSVNLLDSIDKIHVIKKAKKDEKLQKIFNCETRQSLWQVIQQMQPIEIKPQKLPKSEKISEYIRSTTLKTFDQYGGVLCEVFDQSFQQLSDSQIETALTQMEKFLDLIKNVKEKSPLDWYINYVQICEQLANSLLVKCDIVTKSNNFKQIFTFFSQFSGYIQGYDDLQILKIIAEDQLKSINKMISQRFDVLKKTQQNNAKIREIEQEKQQLQQYIKQLQTNLDDSKNKSNSEIQIVRRQLSQIKNQDGSLDEQQQKYLIMQNQFMQIIKQLQQQYQNDKEEQLRRQVKEQQNEIKNLNKRLEDIEKKNKSSCQIF